MFVRQMWANKLYWNGSNDIKLCFVAQEPAQREVKYTDAIAIIIFKAPPVAILFPPA